MSTTQFSAESRRQYNAKAYSSANATLPLAPILFRAVSRMKRRPDRNPLLRSATQTFIQYVTSGVALSIHVSQDMRSLVVSPSRLSSHQVQTRRPRHGRLHGHSDGSCPECQAALEQFCPNMTGTYNSPDRHLGSVTYGGYSDSIVVKEHFVLQVPPNLNLAGAAPLLVRRNYNIFSFAPLGCTKGKKVGVVGLGGLGTWL